MLQILQAYLDVAFFRRGPESIPPSATLFALTLLLDGGLTVLAIASFGVDQAFHLLNYFIGLIMQFSIVWLLLNALQLDSRYLQTITAIIGADVFLTVIQIGVGIFGADLTGISSVSEAPVTLLALDLINWWGLAIIGFAVKRAGNLKLLPTIGVVFSVFVLTRGASNLLLG